MQWDGSQSGLRVPLANHFRGYGGDLHERLSELECKFDPVATVAGRFRDRESSVANPSKAGKFRSCCCCCCCCCYRMYSTVWWQHVLSVPSVLRIEVLSTKFEVRSSERVPPYGVPYPPNPWVWCVVGKSRWNCWFVQSRWAHTYPFQNSFIQIETQRNHTRVEYIRNFLPPTSHFWENESRSILHPHTWFFSAKSWRGRKAKALY